MPADKKDLLFDRRILDRNLEKGVISRKDYEKFLAELEDAKDNVLKDDSED